MTITIDKATLARIRKLAGSRGVSKFIAEAARERAGRSELIALLDELDAKHGPVSPGIYAATDRDMREIFGMPPPPRPWDGVTPESGPVRRSVRAPQPRASARPSTGRRR